MEVRAHKLAPPALSQCIESALCGEFLKGFCRNGDACAQSHAIYRVYDEGQNSGASARTVSFPNVLYLFPRLSPKDDSIFDHDGPGHLSLSGPRHDNDHVDIKNIRILPTTDEVLSRRPPYMPYKDFHLPHFLEAGQPRLLDTLFRQLRFDSTEAIIDACYHAFQKLVTSLTTQVGMSDVYDVRQDTPNGNRYSLFWDVSFEELIFDDTKGIIVRVSFACPTFLRGRRIHSSGFFEDGMLVALLGLDSIDSGLSVTFFETHLRESTDAMQSRGGKGTRAALQLSFALRQDQEDLRRVLYYSQGILNGRFTLIEFPNTLLPGFSWCLKRLQELYDHHDIAFGHQIAPTSLACSNTQLQPPAYATTSDFSYNLTVLQTPRNRSACPAELHLPAFNAADNSDLQNIWLKELGQRTTLDEGQAVALCENLNRGLAFTQGPPGTGKTYLGAALAQVILASQSKATPKPILTVCMTNHALDSFLEDLIKDGITKVARLGGGSKEEWTKSHLLRGLSSKMKLTQIERNNIRSGRVRLEYLTAEGIGRCGALSTTDVSWHAIQDHLRLHYPRIHSQFTTLGSTEYGSSELRLARRAGGFAFYYWSEGGDINNLRQLPSEFATHLGVDISNGEKFSGAPTIEKLLVKVALHAELQAKLAASHNVWSLTFSARKELVNGWRSELNVQVLIEQLVEIHRRHQIALTDKRAASDDIDARCLEHRRPH
ncbi:MAG: hypothetical protein M1830_003607 [Pleopsidium flavum]|nr:MAG: hypothetical protein M1830_003607 [Pleopsidium flavum]